jgi:hypothetical protein
VGVAYFKVFLHFLEEQKMSVKQAAITYTRAKIPG